MNGAGTYRPSLDWFHGPDGPVPDLIVDPAAYLLAAVFPDLDRPRDWRDEALCAETDPEMFFPEKGGTTAPAKKTCLACPVSAACYEYAMANPDAARFGVWGGTSERDRRRIRATAAKAAAAARTKEGKAA